MIYDSIAQCIGSTPLVRLQRLFSQAGIEVIAKLELLNPGGSVKDRPAQFIIEQGLHDGSITPDTHLIESSSGNFGIALAMLARIYNLSFTCVVDPKISPTNLHILRQFGAHIEMVQTLDEQGGYLQTRIHRVQQLLQSIPQSYWINQYANHLNWLTHFYRTGNEIIQALNEPIDCFIAAVSTTGTILGVSRRLRQTYPHIRIVAVDAAGSVIFGAPAGPREIPGIGASRVPELLHKDEIDEVIYVSDEEAVQGCRDLVSQEGIFAGGSSGSVIAGIRKYLAHDSSPCRIVTLLPDRGERYLDLIYNDEWVALLADKKKLSVI